MSDYWIWSLGMSDFVGPGAVVDVAFKGEGFEGYFEEERGGHVNGKGSEI